MSTQNTTYTALTKAPQLIRKDDPFLEGLAPKPTLLGVDKAEKTEEQSDPDWDDKWKLALETALKGLLKKHDPHKAEKTDADFAIAVHQALGQLPRRIAGLEGFWHWLTLSSVVCEEYTRWRWASLEKDNGSQSSTEKDDEEVTDEGVITDVNQSTDESTEQSDGNQNAVSENTEEVQTTDDDEISSDQSGDASATPTTVPRYVVPKARFVGPVRRNALSRLWWAAEVTCDHNEPDLTKKYDYTRRGLAESDVMQYIVDTYSFSFTHADDDVTNNRLWHMLIEEFEKDRIEDGTNSNKYVTDIPVGKKATHKMSGKGLVAMASQLGIIMVTTEFTLLDDADIKILVKQAAVDGIKYVLDNGGNSPILSL